MSNIKVFEDKKIRTKMSKYKPLWEYIAKSFTERLSFEELKNILGFEIDHSFLTYKKELKEYGFEVNKISMKEKLTFFRRL